MNEEMDAIFVTDKSRDESISCKYNIAVACDSRSNLCEFCGWNPDVARERKAAIRSELEGCNE